MAAMHGRGFLLSFLLAVAPGLGATTGFAAGPAQSWITNLSVLADIDSPNDSFTMGYVVDGGTTGSKQLLIRGAGPCLAAFGVTGYLADPLLELYQGSTPVSANDNWAGDPTLAAAISSVGAFPFSGPASLDAAAVVTVSPGLNSARISSAANGGTGTALGEIYDTTPADQFTPETARLINVSVLKRIKTRLAVGFIIAGNTSKTVLIRAIGPSLQTAPYNLGDCLPDPQLTLYGADEVVLGANNDWSGTSLLSDTFVATGAFGLPARSRDAALVATLPPGNYSAVVTDTTGSAGHTLVEVYEVKQPVAPRPDAEAFTIAVLPDSQYYSEPSSTRNGEVVMFTAQTDWIQAQHSAENIVYVAHVGDIVDDGDVGGAVPAATQWDNAVNALRRLESPASVPFGLAVGNHDQEPNGAPNGTTTFYNQYFGVEHFEGRPYYGGHHGTNNDNHYDVFTAGGRKYLVLYVEYDAANARPELLTWANGVVAAHPDHHAILVTHYLAAAGGDYANFGAQGSRLYNALRENSNWFLAFGGHVDGQPTFRRDRAGPQGQQRVTSFVANYQFDPFGGAGFLRLYTLRPDYDTLTCRTYSPYLNEAKTDYVNAFTQSLAPEGVAADDVVATSTNRLVVAAVLAKSGAADTPDRSTIGVAFQQAAKTNTWSDWQLLAGQSGFFHAHVVALADDRVAVLGVNPTGAWFRVQTTAGAAGAWSEWTSIPGTPLLSGGTSALRDIKAVRLGNDRMAVIGWSHDGTVYLSQQTSAGGVFGAWTSLGGSGLRTGDVVRLSGDRLAVFAVSDTGTIQVRRQQAGGTWNDWATIPAGTRLFSYLSVVASPDDSLTVFATRVESRTSGVYRSTLAAGGTEWSSFTSLANGSTGLARIHAVLRPDGRTALFGCREHGVALHCQEAADGSFGAWQSLTAADQFEIGSVRGAVLSDGSLAAVAHGAATLEYFAFQPSVDAAWTLTGGLPIVWTR